MILHLVWMRFPVNGLAYDPVFKKTDFFMDEFSSETVLEISQKFANKG